jgi:hypothetical protein
MPAKIALKLKRVFDPSSTLSTEEQLMINGLAIQRAAVPTHFRPGPG